MTAPIWIGSDGVRRPEIQRAGTGARLEIELLQDDGRSSAGWYDVTSLQELGLALGAPPSEHITTQARESAALLREQGWTGGGDAYRLHAYYGDLEALEERLGRLASLDERDELERLIRAELTEPSR